jgi:hypothetical protein
VCAWEYECAHHAKRPAAAKIDKVRLLLLLLIPPFLTCTGTTTRSVVTKTTGNMCDTEL